PEVIEALRIAHPIRLAVAVFALELRIRMGYVYRDGTKGHQVAADPSCEREVLGARHRTAIKRPAVADAPGKLTGAKIIAVCLMVIAGRFTRIQFVPHAAGAAQIRNVSRADAVLLHRAILLLYAHIEVPRHGIV